VVTERSVPLKLRDGVTLRADLCRPEAEGRFPVLLLRTPYGKTGYAADCLRGAARGYLVVVQDVRGRFESEGDWYPFKSESEDGYDTVEWAAALPASNGKVGMLGGSYEGAAQYLAALARPPHLAGLCPDQTASGFHEGWTYQGGAFQQWFNQTWTRYLAQDALLRRLEPGSGVLRWAQAHALSSYPALEAPSVAGIAPYYQDWLSHPGYDDYWRQWSIEERYGRVQVPVFSLGAWYDLFLGGTLKNHARLKTEAGSEAARRGQRLLVYVSGHSGPADQRKVGAVDFGSGLPIDKLEVALRWYDHLLKGIANGLAQERPVRLFVMGRNQWRDEAAWPLARARPTRYFLRAKGPANGPSGGGALSTSAPGDEQPDQYVYDPADAVPTLGGPLCCAPSPTGSGPQDQRPAEARADVLVYTTPAFTRETEVTGPVSLDLWASTSAVDTDFTGKLVDVWPDGFAQNLTEGILRLRYRTSREKAVLATPGEVYRLTLDLQATSNVFLPGHRLRLEVSSSNFPRFDRNRNTGEEQAAGARTVKATNRVFHDGARPSSLLLPIVP
jgi:hypothetical protein